MSFLCDVSLTMLTHSDAPLLEIQLYRPFYSHQNIWCLRQLKLLFSSWLFDVFIYKDFLFQPFVQQVLSVIGKWELTGLTSLGNSYEKSASELAWAKA